MVRRTRSRVDPFAHPSGEGFDFDALLAALSVCRTEVARFRTACGVRNPAFEEATAVIERIDAFARLTRVPDAIDRMQRLDLID
jgi:hypothetical protein